MSNKTTEDRSNGAVVPNAHEMEEKKSPSSYRFTEAEAIFLRPRIEALNRMHTALNENWALICAQHGLPGNWRMNGDSSGIERVDMPSVTQ
jgi:hypothetical protein